MRRDADGPFGEDLPLPVPLTLAAVTFALAALAGESSEAEAPASPPVVAAPPSPPPAPPPPPSLPAPPSAPPACAPRLSFGFALGAVQPQPAPEAELVELRSWLERDAASRVLVDGHADARGNLDRNLALSYARAREVARWLERRGVPAARITARGFGAYQPVPGEPEAAAQNRRVLVHLSSDPCGPGGER